MTHPLFSIALMLATAGCVSYSHLASQRQMIEGVEQLRAAEARDLSLLQASGIGAAGSTGDAGDLSVQSGRRALADDAAADIAAAKNMSATEDRISALFRASVKAWHAGAAGAAAAEEAADKGRPLCAVLGAAAPPRDCAMLALGPALNGLETQADILLPLTAETATDEGVVQMTRAVSLIDTDLANLSDTAADTPADIQRWVGRQSARYICWAIAAERRLRTIDTTGGPADALASEARMALRGSATASAELVRRTERKASQIEGAITEMLARFEEDYPGAIPADSPSSGCKKIFGEQAP